MPPKGGKKEAEKKVEKKAEKKTEKEVLSNCIRELRSSIYEKKGGMWNAALRRVVRDEEEREREKRMAAQQRLKREALAAVAATATAASTTIPSATAGGNALPGKQSESEEQNASEQASGVVTAAAADTDCKEAPILLGEKAVGEVVEESVEEEEEEEEEDDYIQRHLLSLPKSKWSCLEDSQQAFCLAMNRQKTVFAVGEREGRVSIWDNMSIRVITRELDPTLIILPEEAAVASEDAAGTSMVAPDSKSVTATQEEETKENEVADAVMSGDDGTPAEEEEEKADDSATNDDGSVEADDMDEDDEEEEEEEVASVEEGEGNTEEEDEDDDMEDNDDDNDNDEENEDDEQREKRNAPKKKRTTSSASQPSGAGGVGSAVATAAAASGVIPQDGVVSGLSDVYKGLTLEELRIVKASLKVVTYCAWSCDTRWLFAGCEEKGNRRGRLCVWDVEAVTIFATFSFDAAINCVSAHPGEPDLVLVSYYNSLPVLLNVRTRTSRLIDVPIVNPTINTTVPANSRHPSLIVSAKFGTTGKWIYCATSKSTLAIFDTATLMCLDSVTLPVLIQFIDLSIDYRETALILTSSKGIHEFAILKPEEGGDGDDDDQQSQQSNKRSLQEARAHATGAVRAPWALCCFSDDESFVVGMPVVRHRHVGENGLYTWNRATGRVQHNPGVKDGVNSLAWDTRRDSILAVSTTGALFVLEEEFKTTWSGPMYPAGYRLITDNELHVASMDLELEAMERARRESFIVPSKGKDGADKASEPIDIFTIEEPKIGPATAQKPPRAHLRVRLDPDVKSELVYIPSIPIAHHHKKHHHAFQGHTYNEEKHFGLGQSIFEPLKVPVKPKSSRPKKKASTPKEGGTGEGEDAKAPAPKKKRVRSSIGSQKRRRR